MAEINLIPLIDVMLVLLVIFIVTAPLLTHAIKINLPNASTDVNQEKPQPVTLSIDAAGVYWNEAAVTRRISTCTSRRLPARSLSPNCTCAPTDHAVPEARRAASAPHKCLPATRK
jgi:biopolymer transport protein ExbD